MYGLSTIRNALRSIPFQGSVVRQRYNPTDKYADLVSVVFFKIQIHFNQVQIVCFSHTPAVDGRLCCVRAIFAS